MQTVQKSRELPTVVLATGYPLHADAARSYLAGYYSIEVVQPNPWETTSPIYELLEDIKVTAILVDAGFDVDLLKLIAKARALRSTVGFIYLDFELNLFRLQALLEMGFQSYIYLGDPIGESLRTAVSTVTRGERYFSASVMTMYNRYTKIQKSFGELPAALATTFRMMGQGLSPQEIADVLNVRRQLVHRWQYRLRRHFGVPTNEVLMAELIEGFGTPTPKRI